MNADGVDVFNRRRQVVSLPGVLLCALAACQTPPSGAPDAGTNGAGLAIRELLVEPNPANVLSCFVRWSTDLPATSVVEFGAAGKLAFRVRTRGRTTRHRVLVIGMHQQTTYTLRAVSSTSDGLTGAHSVSYTTGALPAYLPVGRITVHDRRRAWEGWTLMTVNGAKREGLIIYQDEDFVPTAVIYDMQGRPVWYNAHGLGRIGDTRLVDGDRVLAQSMGDVSGQKPIAVELDLSGRTVWSGPLQPPLSVTGSFHHHFAKLPNGNYLGVRSLQIGFVVGDVVVELDRNHKEVWTWNVFAHLRPDTRKDDGSNFLYSWTHINALVPDLENDTLYLNARNINTIFKVRRSTGQILWAFGRDGEFAADPEAQYPWFEQPHGLERLPNGNLIMYDNGLLKRGFSRAVEYAIDEQSRTSRIVWQYRGGTRGRWFVNYWGDADRLPNGNTLITAGTWKQGANSRILEVTPKGELVWELELPIRKQTGNSVGVYNSERISPLVERIVR